MSWQRHKSNSCQKSNFFKTQKLVEEMKIQAFTIWQEGRYFKLAVKEESMYSARIKFLKLKKKKKETEFCLEKRFQTLLFYDCDGDF